LHWKCDNNSIENAEKEKTENAGVKVLGSGCSKCNQLEAATKRPYNDLV